eukprot:CAMPEP_0174242922 /NCGR_PEP_ID=MMETSP0417-20130205/29674_1 /TAXON_ID=242541 /ORGANISM="Mayorella sp, Strain BSH-02190019" /LENGTH=161 /DNA_ID=CAMNT_0015322367 /DNA_START=111 /DNA_END=596 /DNA_ORIENTATION=+
MTNSVFYDHQCNNELCKMQNLPLEKMVEMRGLEYRVVFPEDPATLISELFVVSLSHRESPSSVRLLALYYCLHGTVYKAPVLRNVLSSRLSNSMYHLSQAFAELTESHYEEEDEELTRPPLRGTLAPLSRWEGTHEGKIDLDEALATLDLLPPFASSLSSV